MTIDRNFKIRILDGHSSLIAAMIAILALSATAQQIPQRISLLPSVNYTSGCLPAAVAVGDFDGDSHQDLVVANWYQGCTGEWGPGGVSVLRGKGDGTFQAPVHYFSGGFQALSVAVADLNGDGRSDLVVANSCPDDGDMCRAGLGQIGVLLGNRDGTFEPAISYYSGGGLPNKVVIADINGDGHPDLVVDNYCQPVQGGGCSGPGSVGVLLGLGDGTFQTAVTYETGVDVNTSLAVGDLNGDGHPDVAVIAGQDIGIVSVLLGNGEGTFKLQSGYSPVGYEPQSVAVGDVNGDGHPDLVVASYCQDLQGPCSNGSVEVLLSNGDGTFQSPMAYSSGGFDAVSVGVADINGDGNTDLVVTNDRLNGAFYSPGEVAVLLGRGDGSFESAVNFLSGGVDPIAVLAADVNSDGKPDLLVANSCQQIEGCDGRTSGIIGVLVNNTGSPQYSTSTDMTSSPNPSLFGKLVKFTATVTSTSGSPTGIVEFYSESTTLGSATLVNGSASFSISTLPEGTHYVTAVYQGSAQFNFSASAQLQQIVKHAIAASSTAVVSNVNPSVYGHAVTFSAAVSSSGGIPPDGETVRFYVGNNVLGDATLARGIASLTRSSLRPGVNHISAAYLGDANFAASTSPVFLEFVYTASQVATVTTLISSRNPSIYGQSVTWTAQVRNSGSSIPTGRINFVSGTNVIGTAALNNGVATLTKSNLNSGVYPLIAVYLGDANNGPSASAIVNQAITQATSTAKLTSMPNPSVSGQLVTFTVMIASPTVIPTGPATFTAGTTVLRTVQLSGGKATFTTSSLPVGSTVVKATYNENSNIKGSSAVLTQVVQP
jgi:Bacterial Ig-like domain (group 3)/FG-GAP-like repeat